MICNYNVLTKLHTPLQVAVSILLLMFSSTSLFREAIAAIEEGRHNAAFDRIWVNLPQKTGQEVHLKNVQVDIDRLLPKNRATYRYSGSLTTPPCSEGVRWFVYAEPIQLSSDQIKVFRKIFHGNNRPTQPLNDRTLRYDVVGEIIK